MTHLQTDHSGARAAHPSSGSHIPDGPARNPFRATPPQANQLTTNSSAPHQLRPNQLPPAQIPHSNQLPSTQFPHPTGTQPVLACSTLTKSYGHTLALAGISLAIGAGEAVAVMGPSGSGKTTLLHCLAGILRADAGEITLAGAQGSTRIDSLGDAARAQLRRERFGFVFQQGLLLPELTAVENAALPLMLTGLDRRAAETQAAGWLAHLGLAGLEGRRLGEMSGGQVQRVAIARSQVTGASVTFADEPTGALDQATSAEVLAALLQATVARGRTLVMVTHDEQVAARCSRIVRLQDGHIVHDTAQGRVPNQPPAQPGIHNQPTTQPGTHNQASQMGWS